MKILNLEITACDSFVSKKSGKTGYSLHMIEKSSGHVFRGFSYYAYPVGDNVRAIPNFQRLGTADIIEEDE